MTIMTTEGGPTFTVDTNTVMKPVERFKFLSELLGQQKRMLVTYEIKLRTLKRTEGKIKLRAVSDEVIQSVRQDIMVKEAGIVTTAFDIESTKELMLEVYEKLSKAEQKEYDKPENHN